MHKKRSLPVKLATIQIISSTKEIKDGKFIKAY